MNTNYIKSFVTLFWLVYVLNFFVPWFASGRTIIFWAGNVMAIAHLFEFLIKRKPLHEAGESGVDSFVQTMLYGFLYWQPLLKKAVG
jgi:uncharacterized protein YhhL (DUF1145 family)